MDLATGPGRDNQQGKKDGIMNIDECKQRELCFTKEGRKNNEKFSWNICDMSYTVLYLSSFWRSIYL